MEKQQDNQYFEGILQLRNPSKELLDFVKKETSKRKGVSICKTQKLKNGYDIYFTSQRFLRNLGSKLHKKFKGELKTSRKLHTRHRQTGKNVYRVNVLFKLTLLKKGDTITYRGDELVVMAIGKDILAKNQVTKRKIHIKFKDL